jgi:hypothetical protein
MSGIFQIKSNSISGYSEREMQEDVYKQILDTKYYYQKPHPTISSHYITSSSKPEFVCMEFRIPEIGRISDIILKLTPRKIINIECKLSDIPGVIKQAKDHLKWADYSYILVPDNVYISPKYIKDCIDLKIGILFYNVVRSDFSEVIKAGHNKMKDKDIRKAVNWRLK